MRAIRTGLLWEVQKCRILGTCQELSYEAIKHGQPGLMVSLPPFEEIPFQTLHLCLDLPMIFLGWQSVYLSSSSPPSPF